MLKAKEQGWSGPPFNPIFIAEMMNVRIEANASVPDARLMQGERGPTIEFNPKQPRERMRFSIAHELAHLLFPDWAEEVRNRGGDKGGHDNWQLEMLCNIAAAEIVLPIGSLEDLSKIPTIEELMSARREFDVSVEAFLIRLAKVATFPIGVFVASPRIQADNSREYLVDYYIGSPTAPEVDLAGVQIPEASVAKRCTAIGQTDLALENWITGTATQVEFVGIPGFPGSIYPRVAGLIRFDRTEPDRRIIRYVHGSVLEPRNGGCKILCQLVNDKALKWGGGVARKVAAKFPEAEVSFSQTFQGIPPSKRLGAVVFSPFEDETCIASIVAQEGFGPSLFPRIRYSALQHGLALVAQRAIELRASVHMPRIGTGAAGGEWPIIQEMIDDLMVRAGIKVTVYDPPPKREQLELFD